MKNIVALMLLLSVSWCYGQSDFVGTWKISSQRQLELKENQTFSLTKGPNHFTGTWSYNRIKKAEDQLLLTFGENIATYLIQDQRRDEVRLYDVRKDQVLILMRVVEFDEGSDLDEDLQAELEGLTKEEIKAKLYPDKPFEGGALVINPGYGLYDHLAGLPAALTTAVPAVTLLVERSLGSRIGVGLKLGYRSWEVAESSFSSSLYTAGLRATYHPSFHHKLDTYAGVAGIARLGTLTDGSTTERKWSTAISPVIGARYHLSKGFALTAEFAYDTSTNITVGFAISIN
jgi:hypothetical protein